MRSNEFPFKFDFGITEQNLQGGQLMGINFHDNENRNTYTTREADMTWKQTIRNLVPMDQVTNALDIGCGGGIYSKALVDMGIPYVTGVDFSKAILEGARENCKNYHNITFVYGNAFDTGLDSSSFQLILERALIHHLDDLISCFKEVYRLLEHKGMFIVQDRTPEDCLLKGDNSHIRGYFFEVFPRLAEQEMKRRHDRSHVIEKLKEVGFTEIEEIKFWETRKVYKTKEQLLHDLRNRTGRSILHELNDNELDLLINHIDQSLTIDTDIVERDRWTIWKAIKS